MNLFDKCFLPLLRLWFSFTNWAISNWPVENTIFERVSVLFNILNFEFILQSSNIKVFSWVCPLFVGINAYCLVQTLRISCVLFSTFSHIFFEIWILTMRSLRSMIRRSFSFFKQALSQRWPIKRRHHWLIPPGIWKIQGSYPRIICHRTSLFVICHFIYNFWIIHDKLLLISWRPRKNKGLWQRILLLSFDFSNNQWIVLTHIYLLVRRIVWILFVIVQSIFGWRRRQWIMITLRIRFNHDSVL